MTTYIIRYELVDFVEMDLCRFFKKKERYFLYGFILIEKLSISLLYIIAFEIINYKWF